VTVELGPVGLAEAALEPDPPVAVAVAMVVPFPLPLPDPGDPEDPPPVALAFDAEDELWAKTPPVVALALPVELAPVDEAAVEEGVAVPDDDPDTEDELGALCTPQFGPSFEDLMLL
jgi:hypothetical protein